MSECSFFLICCGVHLFSLTLTAELPDKEERLKHILKKQIYGFAPSEMIHRKNFVQVDTIPYAKNGALQDLVDQYFN